eukprot:CAMPEP_0113298956 /NCGR_PEP_ID=MMETSP0010_2-20120614/1181_1 /TAXON_ID=216773 ORGANISM="Corethron hystrix, Strain 308" /NCGR_SAMPLE_ID=MMETSP0010_2 /ASSEMBLY_ACC=CAM_ASM_000155 /LENGTH=541 /DNA_ID=CAMNT_0000152089 /DNA_START=293 /DNA_END=1918 /DNA_ORIENTATION=- /assembly_acc=CAM_ASM_000155
MAMKGDTTITSSTTTIPSLSESDGDLSGAIAADAEEGRTEKSEPVFSVSSPLPFSTPAEVVNGQENINGGPRGTLPSATINLCSAALGAGVLSLPFAFRTGGVVPTLLLLSVAVAATSASINILVECRMHPLAVSKGWISYESLTIGVGGHRLYLTLVVSTLSWCFGSAVAYIDVVADVFERILPALELNIDKQMAVAVFWLTFMVPLSLMRNVDSLKYSSSVGVMTICILIYTVSSSSISSLLKKGFTDSGGSGYALFPKEMSDILRSCPLVLFAFSCQVNVCAIYQELKDRSQQRMAIVTAGAMTLCSVFYTLVGVLGSINFGADTQANILLNFCIMKDNDTVDPLIVATMLGMACTVTMFFPLNILPCRYTIQDWSRKITKPKMDEDLMLLAEVNGVDNQPLLSSNDDSHQLEPVEEAGTLAHFTLTLIISSLALLTALAVPNIGVVFGLIGGTTTPYVCYVLPGVLAIQLGIGKDDQADTTLTTSERQRRRMVMYKAWGLVVSGTVAIILCTVVFIKDMSSTSSDSIDNVYDPCAKH